MARRCGHQGPNFNLVEIFPLAGVKKARAAIRRLEAAGLITLDGHRMEFPGAKIGRPRPFPRRMLRHLAEGARGSLIATVFGHLICCLFLEKTGGKYRCKSGGLCKASWIATEFGVDQRGVKAARAELVTLGWLVVDPAHQWVWNRFGGSFVISLEWPKSPPPVAEIDTALPPPESDEKPLSGDKDQKPADPGVSIWDVKPEDLKDTARTLELHEQAVEAGIVTGCEADRLNVLAAAEHAKAVGKTNPCGLFISLIRNKWWRFITQADEERARKNLKSHLYYYPEPAHVPASRPTLTEDQVIVRNVKAAAAQAGYRGDAFPLLKREFSEWTRERWDTAGKL